MDVDPGLELGLDQRNTPARVLGLGLVPAVIGLEPVELLEVTGIVDLVKLSEHLALTGHESGVLSNVIEVSRNRTAATQIETELRAFGLVEVGI